MPRTRVPAMRHAPSAPMRLRRAWLAVALATLAAFGVAACSDDAPAATPTPDSPTAAAVAPTPPSDTPATPAPSPTSPPPTARPTAPASLPTVAPLSPTPPTPPTAPQATAVPTLTPPAATAAPPTATTAPPTATAALPMPTSTAIPPTATIASPTSTPAPPTATPIAGVRGGVLSLAVHHAAPHLDVHQEISPLLSTWGPGIVYSRLLRLKAGPDVALPSLAVECELCESWRMEGNTALVFTMRRGVRWQDAAPVHGRLLTAHDLAYSYERQRQPGWPNAGLLASTESVEASGADTLRVSLSFPDADVLVALADGHTKVVAREAVEQSGDLRAGPTVGSGAWTLADDRSASLYTYERNPTYFEDGLPFLDGIKMYVVADEATRNANFRVGRTDVQQIDIAEWLALRERRPNAPTLRSVDAGAGLEFALNTRGAPFDDERARKAALLAMNPWRAVEQVWLGAAFVAQGMPPARADWLLDEERLRPHFADPDAARELLAQLPSDAPRAVEITAGDFGERYDAHARLIAQELAAVGFAVTVRKVNRRVYAEQVWLGGDYQVLAGPIAPMVTPNAYLLSLLHSAGRWNTTGHADAELDALIEAQAQEFDDARRGELARQIQARALEGAYRYMPAGSVSIWSWWPRVRGFHPNFAASEYGYWRKVWVGE